MLLLDTVCPHCGNNPLETRERATKDARQALAATAMLEALRVAEINLVEAHRRVGNAINAAEAAGVV